MHESFPPQRLGIIVGLLGAAMTASAIDVSHSPEYNLTPNAVVDQITPALAISESGGHVVWTDNAASNGRSQVKGRQLGFPLSAPFESFSISKGNNDALEPAIAQFDSGAAIVVWVEGDDAKRNVKGRIIKANGSFAGDVFRIDSNTPTQRFRPSVATNGAGEALVAWTSIGQDGDLKGVFGRVISEGGKKLSSEFQLNTYAEFNQRDPSVASAPGSDDFYCVWVEERASTGSSGRPTVVGLGAASFDVVLVGRRISGSKNPELGEVSALTDPSLIVGVPVLNAVTDGLSVAYCGRRAYVTEDADPLRDWALFTRTIDLTSQSVGERVQWDSESKGGVGSVKSLALGGETVAIWERNLPHKQDILARFGGEPEILNLTQAGIQFQLDAATVNDDHLVTVWSGFNSVEAGFDLFARSTSVTEQVSGPDRIFAFALSPSTVAFSWPALLDSSVSGYRLSILETGETFELVGNRLELTGLAPGTPRSAVVAARYDSGRLSTDSPLGSATSWSADNDFDGLPDDWQSQFFGSSQGFLISAFADFDGDGANNRQEFLAGTNPADPADNLRMRIAVNPQGVTELSWNTVPGQLYQAQISHDLHNWQDYQGIRFAVSDEDSILFDAQTLGAYFRIILLR